MRTCHSFSDRLTRGHRYGLAVVIVTLAYLARMAVAPADAGLQFVTFFPATAVAVALLGIGPGLVTLVAGGLVAQYAFLEPVGSLKFGGDQLPGVAAYYLGSLVVCLVGNGMHRARREVVAALEARIKAQQEAEVAKAEVARLYAMAPVGLCYVDADHRFVSVNETLAAMADLPVSAYIGRTIQEVLPPALAEVVGNLHRQALAGIPVTNVEVVGPRTALVSHLPVYDGERVVGANVAVQDITELAEARRKLAASRDEAEAARAEAQRATDAKSKFLAAASHDLRQPVQSMVLLMQVLREQAAATPMAAVVAVMQQAVDGLQSMLTSLLDVSRLDAGVVEAKSQPVALGEVLVRLGAEYRLQADAKGLRLRVVGTRAEIMIDPTLLERVLRNLVENAIRYTHRGGLVIGCRRRHGAVSIEVADTGIGIDDDHRDAIFEEFYQIDNHARDRTLGLGLGLSIVQRLARLIGARITLRSRPGRGSCFGVILPTASDPARRPTA